MKYALNFVSWNSLKDIFHSVSSPLENYHFFGNLEMTQPAGGGRIMLFASLCRISYKIWYVSHSLELNFCWFKSKYFQIGHYGFANDS